MTEMTKPPHTRSDTQPARDAVPALPLDESRLAMLRRVKKMTLEERLDLFEQLSRDAAWARGAKRAR